MDVSELLGKTLESVVVDDDKVTVLLRTTYGEVYCMEHFQDCCEDVRLEDVAGNLDDLVGSPILLAESVSNSDDPPPEGSGYESYTWTFYRLGTVRGRVTFRWFGESNGYYSEEVSFYRVKEVS